MARRNASLKPHLNQIRTWVGEGVTDIWIAHQLGSTPASIAAFRRQHGLTRGAGDATPAEPAAAPATPTRAEPRGEREAPAAEPEPEAEADATGGDDDSAPAKRRRRGRRGGRGRGRGRKGLVARIEQADGELVVRIDAAALSGDAAAAWADAESATVRVTDAGLELVPEAPAAD